MNHWEFLPDDEFMVLDSQTRMRAMEARFLATGEYSISIPVYDDCKASNQIGRFYFDDIGPNSIIYGRPLEPEE